MANTDAPFGLRPVRHLNGSSWNGQTIRCFIHASYAYALFVGDPVMYQTELDYKDTTGKTKADKENHFFKGIDFVIDKITLSNGTTPKGSERL